jgi:hypothetical protein
MLQTVPNRSPLGQARRYEPSVSLPTRRDDLGITARLQSVRHLPPANDKPRHRGWGLFAGVEHSRSAVLAVIVTLFTEPAVRTVA